MKSRKLTAIIMAMVMAMGTTALAEEKAQTMNEVVSQTSHSDSFQLD